MYEFNLHLLFALTIITLQVTAQKKLQERELAPARGHYKQLSVLNPDPKSSAEEIDKRKFPSDHATTERRLSLKPQYLTHVSLEDFKIRTHRPTVQIKPVQS